MPDNLVKSKAFKLKGRLYTLTVLQLLNTDKICFEQQLEEIIAKAPRLFDGIPIVLDCSALQDADLDLESFYNSLRSRNLLPVAIQGGNPLLSSLAQCMGLAVLNGSSSQDKSIEEPPAQEIIAAPEPSKTKLQMAPVRSGQQLVAMGGDLVVCSTVSHGAELLAEGNIHVYGPLRGRALAGISGDKNARIFCLSLEAELVAIAGCYLLNDAIKSKQGPCQIYLQDNTIIIDDLC